MALFPEVEHRLYDYTFLLNTFATLHFDERNEHSFDNEAKERMKEFLVDNFNTSGQHNYPDEGLQIASDDRAIVYRFTSKYASVKIGRPQYTTFGKSMLPHIVRMRLFVSKVLGLDKLQEMDVRKISVFPVQFGDKTPEPDQVREIMGQILTKDVLSLVTIREYNDFRYSIGPLTFHAMEDKESHYIYEILLGLLKDSKRESVYNVILDANCVYCPAEGIALSEIEDRAENMSKSLYDLFHWAVQGHVIEVMKEGVDNE